MFLRSGDVVIMAGEARECFHELWGLFQGLELAWSKGVGQLEVESDSPCSVKFALKGVGDKHPAYALVKTGLLSFHNANGLVVFTDPPSGLSHLLLADTLEIAFPR
ncbi:hypothetical protein CXB51_001620 [Gossypium anomalum]|uniref:RNase H type-1 domain-containing protein n=1 Tax=Gossypium anomalum TaxID=47600 RepID=A0A8J5Z617_9ROSI|nr:hypothetical protein CXB51_001620 [Gossypium anomalum]